MNPLKVIKVTTFGQNHFMTCYLIFHFRPTYFSYFRKITAISISHNVKKLVDQKWSFPEVKGLRIIFFIYWSHKRSGALTTPSSTNSFRDAAQSQTVLDLSKI